jgi:hypothetical protein
MNRPSSTDMKHLAEFFTGSEWWRLEPHHELILGNGGRKVRRVAVQ